MDPTRFDTIVQSLSTSRSRRGLLAALSGVLLAAVPGIFAGQDVAAKKGKGKGKRKGKGKKGGGGGKGKYQPPHPCANGIKDGAESDVDCGGGFCARCANGKICNSRDDCAGAYCSFATCQECSSSDQCGTACNCTTPATGGPRVCTTSTSTGGPVSSCSQCPPGTTCANSVVGRLCFKLCGAA